MNSEPHGKTKAEKERLASWEAQLNTSSLTGARALSCRTASDRNENHLQMRLTPLMIGTSGLRSAALEERRGASRRLLGLEEKPQKHDANRPLAGPQPAPAVTSADLLGRLGRLSIIHNGEPYTLRITANNKLILTK